jgi:uncharacterized sulfatase
LLGNGEIHWENRDKITASFTAAAIEFIDDAQSNKQPFYINLWPDDVHSPFFPPKALRGGGSKRELYLAVLQSMDQQLGKLFERIRNDAELRNNTIVLICSDNGPEEGAGSAGPFRGTKGLLYEGGIRSPLVVWAPGLMAEDKVGSINKKSFFAAFDLAPSLLEIVRAKAPANVSFDGLSVADALLGKSAKSRGEPLFFRRPPDRPHHHGEGNLPDLAVRDGHWKLLCEYDGSSPELFDLKKDRGETTNVANEERQVVERLTKEVLRWNASMPADEGDSIAASGRAMLKGRDRN